MSNVMGSSSSSSSATLKNNYGVNDEDEKYSVYFKGLMKEEKDEDSKMNIVLGIGVVICDSMHNLVFELSKPMLMKTRTDVNPLEAELEALIEGLNAAKELGIRNLSFLCRGLKLYNFFKNKICEDAEEELQMRPKFEMVNFLQTKFDKCRTCLVTRNDANSSHASSLARKAILRKVIKEICAICLEDIDVLEMLSVHDCLHKCCSSCIKKNVEVTLRQGTLPKCPHEGCDSDIKIDRCRKALSPELVEVMDQRVKESQIPVLERIYCPYPRCSTLMSKREVFNHSKSEGINPDQSGCRMCLKCHGCFCMDCKVPWHSEMTCSDYKKLHPNSCPEDEMLNLLAKRNSWRQCLKCSHMIELHAGCYHIICRCGHQFCYRCGSEWMEKKASCSCPLWDEHRIIYQ